MTTIQPVSSDVVTIACALLLFGVRDDCDTSMRLLKMTDEQTIKLVAHLMSHIIATLITTEHGQEEAEAGVQELIAWVARRANQ